MAHIRGNNWQTKMWTEEKEVSKFESKENTSDLEPLGLAAEFAWCENSKKDAVAQIGGIAINYVGQITEMTTSGIKKVLDNVAKRARKDNSKIAFCLPFISDEMSKKVRASLRVADQEDHVRVVEIPPANLKTQLVRNRLYDRLCVTPHCVICPFGKDGDCMVSGVVYLITCQSCGDHYTGETGRPLCIRIKEHLDGMTRPRVTTAPGGHRRHSHGNNSLEVAVAILSLEPEIVARKTLEAVWITAMNPNMNRKEECIAVTNELALYQDLCGF
ncbi:hypothetical protein Y032_0224g2698 [Ancylostoma ceylanicum]|uniref:GIY-YIG domain-containing protein n=2 Tax=Ancylostoma ceylanicum TaxID=53326 RepID=A0A016SI03_9BILA|nr:hypothetical protein Y032_0224g2698 [Ancylostoma ceylanicum]